MSNKIAIIPLRAGSKGIPNKNKKKMLGRPLYQWALGEAIFSNLDKIYIFTDDQQIIEDIKKEYHWTDKVEVVKRSEESAIDTASTEMGMLELAMKLNYNFDIYCLIQATSPLLTREDINQVLFKVEEEQFDSALTVVENKRFTWTKDGKSVNYDYLHRPRRQDYEGMLVENGAFYAVKKETYLQTKNRLGGKIGIVKMCEDSLYEIDEPSDWDIIEILLKNRELKHKKNRSEIKYLVLDVDGVFTDGRVAVTKDGELSKTFSLRDGMGIELLRLEKVEVIVMTSENSLIVAKRMEKLKLDYVFLGVKDKYSKIEQFLLDKKIDRSNIAYIGDDINDLSNICSCGLTFTPIDGIEKVKDCADYILHNKGGDKAIREAIEIIIRHNKIIKH
ncbi:cytidylyltransferase domain-containing protein [Capnocytophaga bilenii]|jgi:3-deoxy-D-manno-octulosonate 8-phosphate phosphatase, yrbI family